MMLDSDKTLADTSFDWLGCNSEFISILMGQLTSAVMLLNQKLEIRSINNAFSTIFTSHKNENLLYIPCGEALGCAYMIEEHTQCGSSSKCKNCEIRVAGIKTYLSGKHIHKENIYRPFYNDRQEKEYKTLQFSTRRFIFQKEKYVIVIIDDVSNYFREPHLKR